MKCIIEARTCIYFSYLCPKNTGENMYVANTVQPCNVDAITLTVCRYDYTTITNQPSILCLQT